MDAPLPAMELLSIWTLLQENLPAVIILALFAPVLGALAIFGGGLAIGALSVAGMALSALFEAAKSAWKKTKDAIGKNRDNDTDGNEQGNCTGTARPQDSQGKVNPDACAAALDLPARPWMEPKKRLLFELFRKRKAALLPAAVATNPAPRKLSPMR